MDLNALQFNWQQMGASLRLEVKTKDFAEAVWAVGEIGKVADEVNHHPDIEIKDFNNLIITTTTHEAGKLTDKDLALAGKIEGVITRIQNTSHAA